jgi:hypothetical protein
MRGQLILPFNASMHVAGSGGLIMKYMIDAMSDDEAQARAAE